MKRLIYLSAAVVVILLAFTAGTSWNRHAEADASSDQQILHYSCPMHPHYTSDHAGDCPSCGMRLEPVRAEAGGAATGGRNADQLPPGAVTVTPQRQQTIGVRVGVAERTSGTRSLRTTGRVAPNENAVYPLIAGAEGWVRDVRGATTGSLVRRDDVLLSYYAEEFVIAQQAYYSGLDALGRLAADPLPTYNQARAAEGIERYANTLRNLGVSDRQLTDMRHQRELRQYVQLTSPVDGFVLERNAAAGLRFDRGFEFFRIADLREVWILADVYENQLPFIRAGSMAHVTSRDQHRHLDAMVSRAEPIFDEAARTLKIRLETANPELTFKPGMFVDVEFPLELPPTLVVPADAIVDSGLRKTVFVDTGDGYFEPRQVDTGWRIGDQVEVTSGLMDGERIVIAGTFLIDSESRMKAAATGPAAKVAIDPVCGMEVDEKTAQAAGRTAVHNGTTYYFCADQCKRDFAANPGNYLMTQSRSGTADPQARKTAQAPPQAPAPAEKPPATQAKDPVCGMTVDVQRAVSAKRTSVHGGTTFYFCSDACKKKFDAEPAKYTDK